MAKDLGKAFDEVVELWNQQKYIKLLEHLHPKFIMKRIDDPGSIVSGVDDVRDYMDRVQRPQHPVFDPSGKGTPKTWPHNKILGQVSGTGTYKDNQRKNPVNVRFTFTFTRRHEDEDWLLINAFAAEM